MMSGSNAKSGERRTATRPLQDFDDGGRSTMLAERRLLSAGEASSPAADAGGRESVPGQDCGVGGCAPCAPSSRGACGSSGSPRGAKGTIVGAA
jgi:hypothetical protein